MLSKKNRISYREFESLDFRLSNVYHSGCVSLRIFPLKSDSSKRVAFVVSKKVCKTAVGRNLLRRRGFSCVTPLLLSNLSGYFIFYFKKDAITMSYLDICNDILNVISKVTRA